MRSDNIKNTEEKAEITEVSAVDSDVKKQRFGLKIFPETLEIVDTLFEHDNCKSRSEFIEKAVRFYCGYILNKENTSTAFHDTTHHTHIHLLVYSTNAKQGFLTNQGIDKIRSVFTNDIFYDDLQ